MPFNHAPLRLCASTQHENQSQIGKVKNAQSKMPAATSRFSSRRVDLVAFSLLLPKAHRFQIRDGHEIDNLLWWQLRTKHRSQTNLDKFQLPRVMSIGAE